MTDRRVILHIGSPKAGSTYLQRVLLQNRARLFEAGINYPHGGTNHPGTDSDLGKIVKRGPSALFPKGCRTTILSHEDLLSQHPSGAALARLANRNNFEVQVLAFLRPMSEFIYGDYSQNMKQYFGVYLKEGGAYQNRCFEEFAVDRAHTFNITGWLRRWQAHFSDIPIKLAHFKTIQSTMEALVSLPPRMDWTVPKDAANLSLRVMDCEEIAAAVSNPGLSVSAIQELYKSAFHQIGQQDHGRSAERTRWLEALFRAQNRLLYEHFEYDNRLDRTRPW